MFLHTSLSQCHTFEMSYYAVSGVIRIILAAGRDKKYSAENKYLFSVASLPDVAVLQLSEGLFGGIEDTSFEYFSHPLRSLFPVVKTNGLCFSAAVFLSFPRLLHPKGTCQKGQTNAILFSSCFPIIVSSQAFYK